MAELYTDPAFLFLAAGFAVLAVANLARASPRFVASATMMIVVCGPTLRLIQALVCSPAELARDVDSLAEGRLGLLTVCVAGGATFGVQPLPTTRKLLAVGYFGCAGVCNTVAFRVRTGDDRMPSLELLHGFLPFLASFLAQSGACRAHMAEEREAPLRDERVLREETQRMPSSLSNLA